MHSVLFSLALQAQMLTQYLTCHVNSHTVCFWYWEQSCIIHRSLKCPKRILRESLTTNHTVCGTDNPWHSGYCHISVLLTNLFSAVYTGFHLPQNLVWYMNVMSCQLLEWVAKFTLSIVFKVSKLLKVKMVIFLYFWFYLAQSWTCRSTVMICQSLGAIPRCTRQLNCRHRCWISLYCKGWITIYHSSCQSIY